MIWLALLLSLAHPSSAQAPSDTPEMVEARANKAQMKVPPRLVSLPPHVFPKAARAQGAQGEVVVSGIISGDGILTQAKVTKSSRFPLLDATALASAQAARFEPAKDAAGNSIAVPATMSSEFNNGLGEGNGDLRRHTCAQFVRDQDWWQAHWPRTERDPLYSVARGLKTVQDMTSPGGLRSASDDFDKRWDGAIDTCRKQPDALFLDVLKPEGPALRSLVDRSML